MVSTSGPRAVRLPSDGYLRFMHTPAGGLRRVVRHHSQNLSAPGGGMATGAFRRSVEVEPMLRAPLMGTQVSLEPNFAAAARTVLTDARFFNPGDFSDSFAPVDKWVDFQKTEVGQQMIFTRSALFDRAGIEAAIRTSLGSAAVKLPSDMWAHLNNYLVPLLPGKILGPICYYTGKCPGGFPTVAGIAGKAEARAYLKTNHEPNATLLGLLGSARTLIGELLADQPPAAQPVEISLEESGPIRLTPPAGK